MSLGKGLYMDSVKTPSKPLPSRSRGRREQRLTVPTGQEIHSSRAPRLGGTDWFFTGTQSSSPNVNLIINRAGSHSEGDPERSLVSPVKVFISEVATGEGVPHLVPRHSHWALQSKSSSECQCPHFPAGLPQTADHRTGCLPGALEIWGLVDSATSHTETFARWWEPQSMSEQGPNFNLSFSLLTTVTASGQNPCASDPTLLQ